MDSEDRPEVEAFPRGEYLEAVAPLEGIQAGVGGIWPYRMTYPQEK